MYWEGRRLYLLDQRLLPHKIEYRCCISCDDVIAAIKEMCVRGAPAIGISAAYGLVLAACKAVSDGHNSRQLQQHLFAASLKLRQSRPTAVNLAWALERMEQWLERHIDANPEEICIGLEREAYAIFEEDLENNRLIGAYGSELVPEKARILTHCNAGALATAGYGTAIGVIRAAHEQGKKVHVYVDETRPLLQGARLTAFELCEEGIPATLITDNCAGYVMSIEKIDLVLVGADRITRNGDTANKIGTYALAVMAHYHGIPFYIAAPLSTIDLSIASGKEIVIEERSSYEVTHIVDRCIAPEGMAVFNPAFDVTPAALITAIITERGVVHSPDRHKLEKLFDYQN